MGREIPGTLSKVYRVLYLTSPGLRSEKGRVNRYFPARSRLVSHLPTWSVPETDRFDGCLRAYRVLYLMFFGPPPPLKTGMFLTPSPCIFVASPKIIRVGLHPFPLALGLPPPLAEVPMTTLLSIPHSRIRTKITPAEGTVLLRFIQDLSTEETRRAPRIK